MSPGTIEQYNYHMVPTDTRTDEEIASAVQHGDAEAFGELMRRYEPRLERYGKKFLASPDSLEDAIQETFIKAYKSMQSFNASLKFSSWIYRIAHNVFVNELRTKSRSKVFFMDLDTMFPHVSYEDPSEREREQKEMRLAIDTSMQEIAPHYREVLILYYLEEFSYKEIAEVLKIPVSTVGIKLSRARKALEKHLNPALHI